MGYSIRSLQWRLTMWQPFNTTTYLADWHTPPIAVELYDHRGDPAALGTAWFDPDRVENENVVDREVAVAAEMHALLRKMFSPPLSE